MDHLFLPGIRSSPVITLPTIVGLKAPWTEALAIARIYLSSVSVSHSLSSRFFPVCFFFSIFATSTFPRPSLVFSFFRVPACRTCVWIQFHAIPFDREERRKLFLEQPISLYSPSNLSSSLAPRIFDQVLFCFVSLSRLPKRGAEKKAINEQKYARPVPVDR